MGVSTEVPELDSRTQFWLSAFSIASRERPVAMSGISPLPPLKVLQLADRLEWPCEDDECLAVLGALDDCWRELQQQKQA